MVRAVPCGHVSRCNVYGRNAIVSNVEVQNINLQTVTTLLPIRNISSSRILFLRRIQSTMIIRGDTLSGIAESPACETMEISEASSDVILRYTREHLCYFEVAQFEVAQMFVTFTIVRTRTCYEHLLLREHVLEHVNLVNTNQINSIGCPVRLVTETIFWSIIVKRSVLIISINLLLESFKNFGLLYSLSFSLSLWNLIIQPRSQPQMGTEILTK